MSEQLAEALTRAERAAREKRFGEADGICRDILRIMPNQPIALGIRGMVAAAEHNMALAITMLEPAVVADPANPMWRTELADAYRMVYRLDEALVLAREAAAVQPRQARPLVNLAKVHNDRGELDDALLHFLGALACDTENPQAHFGIAEILLARREFRPGWIEYEWRNRWEAHRRYPGVKAPLWNGMHLPQGRVLLIADQGFGDAIQFCRYIPMVAERCAEVMVVRPQELRSLIVAGRTFDDLNGIPGFAAYTLLSSLPFVFGTDGHDIPATIPYVRPEPARVAHWRDWLDAVATPGRLRVGVFWSGQPAHPNNLRRSLQLRHIRPLLDVPGVQFVSLQKQVPQSDAAELASLPTMVTCAERLSDFGETAALISVLDLVITIDSAVAHLAGALGQQVWTMIPSPCDWRWQLDRTDSPWYPSMTIFRQAVPGGWDAVMDKVVAALRTTSAATLCT